MWNKRLISAFLRRDAGNATVEFAIVFPIIIMIFVAAFETAMLLTRQVMLERSLDNAVRYLRLTSGVSVTYDAIRDNICENTAMIADCQNALALDLRSIDQTTYALPNYQTMCVDQDGTVHPLTEFNPGSDDELMLIRVCALVDRILPISGLGLELTRDEQDNIHLIAASIFVNEPE